jgi:chromate transporter
VKDLISLYFAFFRLGLFTFGGGMGMLPILQRELIEKRHWITEGEMMDYYAIAQCTPGVLFVNTATFIGYKKQGAIGGAIATMGIVTPAILIISVIAAFLRTFASEPLVHNALAGIRVCVCALIVNTVIRLLKVSVIDKPTAVIFVLSFLLLLSTSLSPVFFVIAAGLAGVAVKRVGGKL